MFLLKPKWQRIWGKSGPEEGVSWCKGPEVAKDLVWLWMNRASGEPGVY